MFSKLSAPLIMTTFEFLTIRDINSVAKTCKRFSHIVSEHYKFWMRECLRMSISFDLESYCELYDYDEYKTYIKAKANCFPKRGWKKHLEEGSRHKSIFSNLIRQLVCKEEADLFMSSLYETLKQPNIPIVNLKRETIICNTNTQFQNKLSEVLYEDSGLVSKGMRFLDERKVVIDTLADHTKKNFQELLRGDKKEFLKLRWYMFEARDCESEDTLSSGDKSDILLEIPLKKSDPTTEETMILKSYSPYLVQFYEALHNILCHYCGTIYEYLNALDNVYDIIAEYTARWKTFVCTMLEFENIFETFVQEMNAQYEQIYEGYPTFPKFSMWRMMTKIWMKEVYDKGDLSTLLDESFLRVLSNHREQGIKETMNKSFTGFSLDESRVEMPKSLYISLNTRKKRMSSVKYSSHRQLKNHQHSFFTSDKDSEKRLLSGYLQSVLDLSLNEVNVHYLDCTNMPTNYPYSKLEEALIKKSNDFYLEYQSLFQESPTHFCQFLKADCSLLTDIITERTKLKLETIQVQNGLEFTKNFIGSFINKLTETSVQEIKQFQSTNILEPRTELDDFIEGIMQEITENLAAEQNSKEANFYQLPPIEEEEIENEKSIDIKEIEGLLRNKEFLKNFFNYLDSQFLNLRTNFEYLKQRFEHFERVKIQDKSIKQYNMDKNIPCELGDIDCIFYDLDKQVDFTLLEKMYQDYKMYEREQNKGDNHKDLGGLPPIDDLDDDMPPQISMKKTTSTLPNSNFNDLTENNDEFDDPELAELPSLGSLPRGVSTIQKENMANLIENTFEDDDLDALGLTDLGLKRTSNC